MIQRRPSGCAASEWIKYEVARLFEEIQSLFGKSDEVKMRPFFCRFSIDIGCPPVQSWLSVNRILLNSFQSLNVR